MNCTITTEKKTCTISLRISLFSRNFLKRNGCHYLNKCSAPGNIIRAMMCSNTTLKN